MLNFLEKRWPPFFSAMIILAMLTCLLIWPGIVHPLGLTVLLVSLLLGTLLVSQKHLRAYRKGQLDRTALVRNLAGEISGVLLTFAAVFFLAGRVAQAADLAAGSAAEVRWPGSGTVAGLLAGVLVGLMVGPAASWLVQTTWGRLVKRPQAVAQV